MGENIKKEFINTRNKKADTGSSLVFGKVPPQDKEVEEVIIGVILLEPDGYERAVSIIKDSNAFYVDAHRKIMEACNRVYNSGSKVDFFTVQDELRKAGDLEIIGGPHKLSLLTENVVSGAHLEDHCRIVYEKFILREIIRVGGEMVHKGYNDGTDVFEVLNEAERSLSEIGSVNAQAPYKKSPELLMQVLQQMDETASSPQAVIGLSTGYKAIDRVIYGLQDGDYIILAARPSMGKTAFALNLGLNVGLLNETPAPVGIFSLEMKGLKITRRMLAAASKIKLDHITRGKIPVELNEDWQKAIKQYASAKILVDDSSPLNIHQLRTKARRMVNKDGVRLIIIDYLQLMDGIEKSTKNREQEISKISSNLKSLAKELNIPIIALAQLSREIEKRKEKKPLLSDLRESGAIEQDADIIMFLHNESYQKTDKDVDPAIKDDAMVYIAKNRDGVLKDIAMKFVKDIQKWFSPTDYSDYLLTAPKKTPTENTDDLPF